MIDVFLGIVGLVGALGMIAVTFGIWIYQSMVILLQLVQKKWRERLATVDYMFKYGMVILLGGLVVLSFNYLTTGNPLTPDFWGFISGLIQTIGAIIAIIFFLRRAIISSLYTSAEDYVVNEFFDVPENATAEEVYQMKSDAIYLYFSNSLKELGRIQTVIIKAHSAIVANEWGINLEMTRAIRRDWFRSDEYNIE